MPDLPEGRFLIPGHAIEASWFIMQEGIARKDRTLIDRACNILLWELEFGWDSQYGGITYFMDSEGKPPLPLESDMKLWWCHNEALIALLYAIRLKGGEEFESWYDRVHDYTFRLFPDPEYGEWLGYFHRDGRVALRVKGSNWKGCFHMPRHLLFNWLLLKEMEKGY
jgi:N-acylglucosamine 2-epimerase